MNAFLPFDSAQWWQLAGWTMVHFLWLGAAAAALALLCRLVLRKAAPNIRYAAALTCLLLLSAMPLAIATWLASNTLSLPAPEASPSRAATFEVARQIDAESPTTNGVDQDIIELSRQTPLAAAPASPHEQPIVERPAPAKQSPISQVSGTRISFASLQHFVPYLPWLWLIGTPITFALLAMGVVGTKRLRQSSRTIDDACLTELLTRACAALQVRARVGLAACDRIATPVLIGILRPMILLPPAALTGWSPDEIEMVLLHELAHVRRWDNLVNLLQRCIESLLFFHPAVWFISTWVRREREDCCDAIVVRRTERPHAYAELLVALAAQMPRSVLFHPVASSAMSSGPLHTRIRRILQLESDPMLISGKSFAVMLAGILAAATFTVLYVPTIGQAEESAKSSIEIDGVKLASLEREIADDPDKFATAHLPYAVEFEQGASRFAGGDNITILDVRGTSRTFELGNVYQIKGKYTLGSRDSARLAAFTTAKKPSDGTGPVWKIQATDIDRGEGTFTLFLPMSHNGWPHISFYPKGGGDNFGGTYFGTGDSVLKKWWKSGEVIDQTASSSADHSAAEEDASTNWLKEINFATAEDRDVAKRAWKELGVKFVPADDEELAHIRRGDMKGGLKALDLEDSLNVKPPIIFTHFQSRPLSTGIPDFATLNKALDALTSGRQGEIVVLNGINKGGGVIQYSIRWPIKSDNTDAPSHPKFPSLEDQKLADLAYKRLQLELEPIGDKDLARIKKFGYDGGVKVVGSSANDVRLDDILVGLHVWPTTSLADIATILKRDDIADLSPLKFYVVRPGRQNPGYPGGPIEDTPVTGRISVQLNRKSGSQAFIDSMRQQSNDRTESIPRDRYYYSADSKQLQNDAEAPPYVLPSPEDEDNRPKSRTVIPGTESKSRGTERRKARRPASALSAATNKEALRYDDKSFDEWRDLWKNELSTTKRTEAIKALAAFARAGYGKEATEAILDVAGEYDFNLMSNDPEGKLKTAVVNELLPESGNDDLAKYWLPDLAARLKQDPDQWGGLTWNLMGRLRTDDPKLLTIVRSFVADRSPDVRSTALSALIRSSKSLKDGSLTLDDQTRKLMTDALKSGEPNMIHAVLEHLLLSPQSNRPGEVLEPTLIFQPELVPLLFHDDEYVRQRVRGLIQFIDAKDAPKVVEHLTAQLQDQSPERRLAAIQALAALGPKADAALPSLKELVNSSSDREALIATYIALQEINRKKNERQGTPYNVYLFVEGLDENEKNAVLEKIDAASPNFNKNIADESAKLVPQIQNFGGGGYSGGGFF